METKAEVERELIVMAAELLRGVADGKTFDSGYFRAATLAFEALRDGDVNRARTFLSYARIERGAAA